MIRASGRTFRARRLPSVRIETRAAGHTGSRSVAIIVHLPSCARRADGLRRGAVRPSRTLHACRGGVGVIIMSSGCAISAGRGSESRVLPVSARRTRSRVDRGAAPRLPGATGRAHPRISGWCTCRCRVLSGRTSRAGDAAGSCGARPGSKLPRGTVGAGAGVGGERAGGGGHPAGSARRTGAATCSSGGRARSELTAGAV